MYSYVLVLALVTLAGCEEKSLKTTQYEDTVSLIDRLFRHSIAEQHLWPWNQFLKAAAEFDTEEHLENPHIISNSEIYQVNLVVKKFTPDELQIKVKNRQIIVEGKCNRKNNENKFMVNHFVQRFVLPPGTNQEEVRAVFTKKHNMLSITAPKHELPSLPEIEVPIEVVLPAEITETPEENLEEDVKDTATSSAQTSSVTPLDQMDLETTTHVGKIRKKELKTLTEMIKDNEVTKRVDGNGLEYVLIENDE